MASKDVFNLLNLYQDDDDDDMDDVRPNGDDEDEETETEPQRREEEELRLGEDDDSLKTINDEVSVPSTAAPSSMAPPSMRGNSNSTPKWSHLRPPTPLQSSASDSERQRREKKPNIVDYAHDDVAMSPEAEEGEFLGASAGRAVYGEEFGSIRDFPQRTPTANVQMMTPGNQAESPQLSAQFDADNSAMEELETEVGEGMNISGEDGVDSDPVQKFLPPSPQEKCSDELQEKINKFLAYKRHGKSFNVEVRNRKDYRNPDFLRHAVRYQDIDEIGSCFAKDVFDPHGYDKSDYFDAIEADMKREMERKELERKKSQKVDFISGGTQAGVAAAQKVMLPSPGVSNVPSAGLQSGSVEMLTREGRQNKKSKWDKVDGDRRSVLGGGPDGVSAVGAHATLLSASNAGAGYAVFTQQKRREAEERRSSDRKAERRT